MSRSDRIEKLRTAYRLLSEVAKDEPSKTRRRVLNKQLEWLGAVGQSYRSWQITNALRGNQP